MDETKRRLYTDQCRKASDEELVSLLRHADSLVDELKQGTLDALAERPNADEIRRRGSDWSAPPPSSDRPSLGFWLGFLTFVLGTSPVKVGLFAISSLTNAERMAPRLSEMGAWHAYKMLTGTLWVLVLIAAIVGIRTIHVGRTRRHLHQLIAVIWFIWVGTTICDLVVTFLLFGYAAAAGALQNETILSALVTGIVIALLWTAYLTLSQRCQRRYPAVNRELATVTAFD
jgi:hypothetical protein